MPLDLKPRHLNRYRQIALLLLRHGNADLVGQAGIDGVLGQEAVAAADHRADAESLAADLEAMGPTFIKLGQLLSSRVDLLPPDYTAALTRLQDRVDPFPFAEVERIVADQLGARLSRVFADFDAHPLASASLGQVHRAVLRGGDDVVVKVQRPGVREQVAEDMDVLGQLSRFLDKHSLQAARWDLPGLLDEFRRSLVDELNYRREASNLLQMAEILTDRPLLVVPRPYPDLTTTQVLTMARLSGTKVTDMSPVALLDLDTDELAATLFGGYLDQILVHGFFHADPHPGNILLLHDGRLGLVDLGQVGHVDERMREQLVRILLAVAERKSADVARLSAELCQPLQDFDEALLRRHTAELVDRTTRSRLADAAAGSVVLRLTEVCSASGLRPPPALAMVGKALVNLDTVARTLAPDFDPVDVLRRHTMELVRSGLRPSLEGTVGAMLQTKDLLEQGPARLNRLLERLSEGELSLQVHAFDEQQFLQGLHRMANRVATGVVVAALVVGAALMAQVNTTSRILGYPSVAFVMFLLAAVAGFTLLVSILLADRRARTHYQRPDRSD